MLPLPVYRTLHWCSLRISDFGVFLSRCRPLDPLAERIWDLGGSLECWADERSYEKRTGKKA